MDKQKISETEALDIIARVFDRNMRRMNYVRGELFICWGALLSLTALAEYGPVSYTHLDVYKRQSLRHARLLQDNLRKPYPVRVTRATPGQVTAFAGEPG